MKKRFTIVLGDEVTAEHNLSFSNWLKATHPRVGWWHRVANVWLLVDLGGGLTARSLRDGAMKSFPGVNCLVLEFSADGASTWSGFGPNEGLLDWFTWIKQNWQ